MIEAKLKETYEALYAEVAEIPSTEYVCHNLSRRLAEAEMALTDHQIAAGTFKW